jgi:hypothetical protein
MATTGALITVNMPSDGQVFQRSGGGGTVSITVSGEKSYSTRSSATKQYEREVGPVWIQLGGSLVGADETPAGGLKTTWSATVNASAGISQVVQVETIIVDTVSHLGTGDVISTSTRPVTLTRSISVL